MPIYVDENVVPTGRMKTRSSTAKDTKTMGDKRNKDKGGLGGTKRSALGDVTNRQADVIKVQGKKSGSIPANQKPRVLRKSALETQNQVMQTDMSSPVMDSNKPLPTCISSNLKEMSLSKRKNLHDIDSCESNNELSVWQYAEDINSHFLEMEKHRMPNADYMDHQSDVNSKMRAILVDWLVDVHAKYSLLPQTLHIAVDLIDRYLDNERNVRRQRLQLVGITAMFIASKYEEIYPPEASEFVRITDNAYSTEDVFTMEECMLKTLTFRVTSPTAHQFLMRFLKASKSTDPSTPSFAHYVIDCALQEYSLMKYPPSAKAAAAIHIARMQMDELPIWNATLEYHTSYSKASLAPCVREIMEIIWKFQNGIKTSSKLTAVKRKYSKDKFLNVSLMELKDDLPEDSY